MCSQRVAYLLAVSVLAGCNRQSADTRQYTVQGQVLSVASDRQQATIKHEEIKGFMAAMTMPYKMKDPKVLDSIAPGDLVSATLLVVPNNAYITEVKKVGQAPLEPPAPAPSASSGFEELKVGEAVPNVPFVDQEGRKVTFNSFKGWTVLLTFTYTRCPMVTFCPMMDRNFAAIQQTVLKDPDLAKRVHLVTVTFDPATDTPPVLKKHAETLKADLRGWTFLTGDRDEIDRFGARFGLSVARSLTDPRDIQHTLRTALIDSNGQLVKVYIGNEWKPEQALADLQKATGAGGAN